MRFFGIKFAAVIALSGILCLGADVPKVRLQSTTVAENSQRLYFWRSTPVGNSAQMLTLFFREHRGQSAEAEGGLPVVSVLRDTLGDADPENDRLVYAWLLSYTSLNTGQKVLSAVPFFYWRLGEGSKSIGSRDTSALLNLSAPEHTVLPNIARTLFQWTTLDPMGMPVRAVTRSYRANQVDNERFHIQEAITFLENAPVSDSQLGLTAAQLHTLIARLELRKELLGGLVTDKAAASYGEQSELEHERIRSRNWELMRQCAEKTGLYFQSLDLAGAQDEYAILWYPVNGKPPQTGTSLAAIWKLLNIGDPWADTRIRDWKGATYARAVDASGSLLAAEQSGVAEIQMVPLAVYSLTYPKQPLLLIDFRDKLHVRRHEMTQRSINQITAGLIGLSHFTNWYYYLGADLYDFVVARHGRAMDAAARLDCYAEFRANLFLDDRLPSELRDDLQRHVTSLSINPLGATPDRDFQVAKSRYAVLQANSEAGGAITKRLDKERRAELPRYTESPKARVGEAVLHTLSFGVYTHRSREAETTLAALDMYRRAESQIDFLESLADAGTPPEIAYESSRIQASIAELRSLIPGITSRSMISRASASLEHVRTLSRDSGLQSDCTSALAAIQNRNMQPVAASRDSGMVAINKDAASGFPAGNSSHPSGFTPVVSSLK